MRLNSAYDGNSDEDYDYDYDESNDGSNASDGEVDDYFDSDAKKALIKRLLTLAQNYKALKFAAFKQVSLFILVEMLINMNFPILLMK